MTLRMLHAVADTAFPPHCRGCDEWSPDAGPGPLCARCIARLDLITGPVCGRCGQPLGPYVAMTVGCALCHKRKFSFDQAVAAITYDDAARPIIHRFKYGGEPYLKVPLARLLAAAVKAHRLDQRVDGVTAVPLHWRRRWTRGYNQAGLLAHELARTLHLPETERLIRRNRPTQSQALSRRAVRLKNMQGAFVARPTLAKQFRRVLLVDDVMSTGATGSACAAALKAAGVEQVYLATVAH